MKLTNRQKWLRTIVWLKKMFPPQRSITATSCKTEKEVLETAELIGGSSGLGIKNKLDCHIKIEILLREWARFISCLGDGHEEDHPDDWGLAYAKIYRTFIEWEYGRPGTLEDSNVI